MKSKFWKGGLFVVLVALPFLGAFAASPVDTGKVSTTEDLLFLDIPQITTASKVSEPWITSASTVYVVTADEIKRFGFRNLGDILRYMVPNSDESNTLDYRQYGQRGFYSNGSNTLLLMDGRQMNSMSAGTVMLENWYLTQDIERVEVVMGPDSSVYGSSALDGVINIITKHGRETKEIVDLCEASMSVGDAGRYQYEGTFRINRPDFAVGGAFSYFTGKQNWKELGNFAVDTYNYRRSTFNTNAAGTTVFNNNPSDFSMDAEELAIRLNVRYKDFYAGVNMNEANNYSGLEYAFYGFEDNHQERNDTHLYGGWKHEFENGLTAGFEYQHSMYDGKFLVDSNTATNINTATSFTDLVRVQTNIQHNQAYEDKLSATVDYQLFTHHLLAGFEYWTRYDRAGVNTPTASTMPLVDENFMNDTASARLVTDGLFFQDSWQIIKPLKAVLGAYLDDERGEFQKSLVPKAALVWEPITNSVFKFDYSEGFRGPLAGEIKRNAAAGGFSLRPQDMKMFELTYNQLFKIVEGWTGSNQLSLYDMKLANRIITSNGVSNSGVVGQLSVNKGGERVQGVEDMLKVTSNKFSMFMGMRYISPEREKIDNTSFEEVIKWVPRFKTQMGVSYKFFDLVEPSLTADYWGRVQTPATVYNAVNYTSSSPIEIYTIKPHWSANFNLNIGEFKLDKFSLLVTFYVNNLFDAHYCEASWNGAGGFNPIQFEQLPRNYWLTVKVKF
jgi:outer membrane receptor for ferrienterochelin and colicin